MNNLLRNVFPSFLSPHLLRAERVDRHCCTAPPEWTELLLGQRNLVCIPNPPSDSDAADRSDPKAVFPGSFNPLHRGHTRMAEIASKRLGQVVWFELSITNVDKPPLDFLTVRERLDQLASYNVCLTRAPTFVEKADLFPGATFVVGVDTLARIADEKYYHGDRPARDAAIGRLALAGTRFLAFGRTLDSRFATPSTLALPTQLAALCEEVEEAEFHEEVSSTLMRAESRMAAP